MSGLKKAVEKRGRPAVSQMFAPSSAHELVSLVLTRRHLKRRVSRRKARIRKVLADAGLGLARVVTDILGKGSRAVLAAIIAGEDDLRVLVERGGGRLKVPKAELSAALRGRVNDFHRALLQLHLHEIDALERALRKVEERMAVRLCQSYKAARSLVPANRNARR